MPAALLRPAAWPLPGSLPPRFPGPRGAGGFTLRNSLEGGTSGQAVTNGNSGGLSGSRFDVATVTTGTLNYDNSTAAHGSLSLQAATGSSASTSFVTWSTSFSNQGAGNGPAACWFGFSFSPDAIPGANTRMWGCNQGASTSCASVQLLTTGALRTVNTAAGTLKTSATILTPAVWYRIEGFVFGDASNGVFELRIYTSVNAVTPAEVLTSTGAALAGPPNLWRFGISGTNVANVSLHYDDLALSALAYPGPAGAFNAVTLPVAVTLTPALQDQAAKALAVTVVMAGSVRDQVARTLAGPVTPAASLQDQVSKALAASAVTAGTLGRAAAKTHATTVSTAAALRNQAARTLAAAVATPAFLGRAISRAYAGTAVTAAALGRALARTHPVAMVTSGSLGRRGARTLTADVSAAAELASNAGKVFAAPVVSAGALARGIGKLLRAAVSTVASWTGIQPPHVHHAVIAIAAYGPNAVQVTIASPLAAAVAIAPYGANAADVTIAAN